MVNIEAIIWYAFVFDSLGANIAAWFFPKSAKWFKKKLPQVSKHLPLTKGWAFVYLVLVLWVGWTLDRLGVLWW
jgi:hypothetical protein